MLQISVKKCLYLIVIAGGISTALPALAHTGGHAAAFGLSAGWSHPFSGADHMLAMLAVGLWAAQNQRPARWLLPAIFPLMMAAGAALSMTLGVFNGMEAGVAATVAMLGLLIAFALKLPIRISVFVIALFALLHGYAHGTELPHGVSALSYIAGFMLSSALLHIAGIAIGLAAQGKYAARAMRGTGAAIAATGLYCMVFS